MILIPVSEDVLLRPFSLMDASDLYHVVERFKDYLGAWMPWPWQMESVTEAQAFIRHNILLFQEGKGVSLAIIYKNQFVGEVSFTHIDSINNVAQIGYWLGEEWSNKGITSSCLEALCQYGVKSLGFKRLEIRVQVENKISCKIPEKLGFELEATLKSACKNKSTYHDLHIYSKVY